MAAATHSAEQLYRQAKEDARPEEPEVVADSDEFELTPGTPLHDLYERRVKNNQDLTILVTDRHNRRGTGKSILSCKLAEALDRTEDGFTEAKATLDAEEFVQAYTAQPKGSALVLDEAEKSADKYTAGSITNRALREYVSMGRIEEKYAIFNLPASTHLDKDLKALCDVWIMVQTKGRALVHFLKYNPYGDHEITKKEQMLTWSDVDRDHEIRNVYDALTDEKKTHLREDAESYVTQSEHEELLERAVENAKRETRDEWFWSLKQTGMKGTEVAALPHVDVSADRVNQIVRNRKESDGE